jgi:hypothetical protein
MAEAFERIIRQVARRSGVNMLLEQTAFVLILGALATGAAVTAQRALSLHWPGGWALAALAAAMLAATGVLTFLNWPRRMETALLIDERLGARERFSTALAVAAKEDSFSTAARVEAVEFARKISSGGRFPIRPSRLWLYAGGGWCLVLAVVLWLPELDLLGAAARNKQKQDVRQQQELAKSQVREAAQKVDAAVKRLDPNMGKDLEALAAAGGAIEPSELKLQAIQKLTDLKDKVKQMQAGGDSAALEQLKGKLKSVHPGKLDPAVAKVQRAMAKGDFESASKALRDFQKDLAQNKYSPQQQQQMAEQLAQLAQQLTAAAQDRQELARELEKQGLTPELAAALAKMTPEQLQKALQQQGLSAQQIEKLTQQAQAMAQACKNCQGLAGALGDLAGAAGQGKLNAADLAALGEQLSGLEVAQLREMQGQASLDQIEQAIALLGQMQGQGLDLQGQWQGWQDNPPGPGMGAGPGYGPRPIDPTGKTAASSPSGVNNAQAPSAPPIASWAFQGAQMRGETRKDVQEILEARQEGLAEAVEEKQIPRRHEKLVKDYYEKLEKGGS